MTITVVETSENGYFNKSDLQEIVWEENIEINGHAIELIENEITDTSRWSNHYRFVVKWYVNKVGHPDKYFEGYYSKGATEQQEELPFENDPDIIKLEEVVPVEITKTVYKKINAT